MQKYLATLAKKMDYIRIATLVVMIGMIAVTWVRAAVPIELQDLYQASTKTDINANKFVGGLNTCDKTGKCNHPFAVTSTTLSHLLGSATGITQTADQAYRLGPPLPNEQYLSYSPGALGTTTEYMALALGSPMISSSEYIADVMRNLRVPGVDTAYAQGLGFSSLSPVLEIWKLFRNMAYFFFVVVFLLVGMMIMFRSQIGEKAAITVQQALPKMIVSLLLVTFSYAIAGLMIDLMYLLIYLAIAIFQNEKLSVQMLTEIAFRGSFVQNVIGPNSLLNTTDQRTGAVGEIASALGNIVIGALNLEGFLKDFVQTSSNLIFTVVIAFALLVSVFRVFFALIQAYIGVFFSVIFAPIILLIGAMPGQNTFGTWIKGLVENLLVFPVLIVLIFIGFYFTNVSFTKDADTRGFSPPQLGSNQTDDGFAVYSALIPFAAILAMPEILKITKGLMKGELGVSGKDIKQNFKVGAQLGVPAVAGAALGLPSGLWSGVQGIRKGSPSDNAFSRFVQGATIGYKPLGGGDRVGGFRQGFVTGLGWGERGVAFADRASEGQVLDPSTSTRQMQELLRATKKSEKPKEAPAAPPPPAIP